MPIEDAHVRNEIESIFKALLADNSPGVGARAGRHRGTACQPKKSERRRPAQVVFMRRRERARRLARRALGRRHVAVVTIDDACRGRRRRLEHRAPARVARRRRVLVASARCSASAPTIEPHGEIPEAKLAAAADCVAEFAADRARARASSALEVLITSPGRQAANGRRAARRGSPQPHGCPVRVLTAAEEGRLAFVGARRAPRVPRRAASSPSSTSAAARRRSSSARAATGRRGRARSISARSG